MRRPVTATFKIHPGLSTVYVLTGKKVVQIYQHARNHKRYRLDFTLRRTAGGLVYLEPSIKMKGDPVNWGEGYPNTEPPEWVVPVRSRTVGSMQRPAYI
jgi:hypothetical protein